MAVFPSAEVFLVFVCLWKFCFFFLNVAFADSSRLQTVSLTRSKTTITNTELKSISQGSLSARGVRNKKWTKRGKITSKCPERNMFFFLLSLSLMSLPFSFPFCFLPLPSALSFSSSPPSCTSSVFTAPVNLMPRLPARLITVRQTHLSTGKCESAKSKGREEEAKTENWRERQRGMENK